MTKTRCDACRRETDHRHMHDSPHGLPGAHMAGTERYECEECRHAIFAAEGVARGLNFILDAPGGSSGGTGGGGE